MRTKKGIVTSAKMTNTVSVNVQSSVMHPIYKKSFRRSKKFLADSNCHDLYKGDVVTITECRPLSKNKHFKVTEILIKAPRVDDVADESTLEKAIHREKHAPEIVKKEEPKKEEASSSASTQQASKKATEDKEETDSQEKE